MKGYVGNRGFNSGAQTSCLTRILKSRCGTAIINKGDFLVVNYPVESWELL